MAGKRQTSVEVVALTDHEWRVCDGEIEDGDARRVLGYVEELSGHYEVLALKPAPLVCGSYDCWDEAVDALLAVTGGRRIRPAIAN